MGHMMLRVLSNILCNHDLKVNVKSKKAGICDGVPSTHSSISLLLPICPLDLDLSSDHLH